MTGSTAGYDLFISYARGSAKIHARALRDALVRRRRSVFLDEREIPYGSTFPQEIAAGLRASRMVAVFLDEDYLSRPWCIYELQVVTAPYRAAPVPDAADIAHLVVALGGGDGVDPLIPHLPPPAASRAWPTFPEAELLADLVEGGLSAGNPPLGTRLEAVTDDAARRLRVGGEIPLPWPAEGLPGGTKGTGAGPIALLDRVPQSLQSSFLGRAADLWRLFDALVTPRAFGTLLACAVQGPGGSGKSQLAAEFVWRYGRQFFPGGVVWISANRGDAALIAQLRDVLARAGVDSPDPSQGLRNQGDQLEALQEAVAQVLAGRRDGERILWVVDGIPEPSRGAPPRPLEAWCPSPSAVALLTTSRRATLEGIDRVVEVASLEQDVGVALLTLPPVHRDWLAEGDWADIARWVGSLPLALSILRDALINGMVTAHALALAQGREPASLLDEQVDALRGEVAEPYLRGIGEAFAFSYAHLAEQEGLQEAACLFARLASLPIAEDLVASLIPSPLLGRLSKRSWIQASSPTRKDRHWGMHRIPASFLHSHSGDPAGDYARLFAWLHNLVASGLTDDAVRALEVHIRVIIDEFLAGLSEQPERLISAVEKARVFAVAAATTKLEDTDQRGLRFLASGLAERLGATSEVLAHLGNSGVIADNAKATNVPNLLRAMSREPAAASLMVRLLHDARDEVRWQAMSEVPGLPGVEFEVAMLRAFLSERDDIARGNLVSGFDIYLGASNPRLVRTVDLLLDRLRAGSRSERSAAAQLLGRVLLVNGVKLQAGGHSADELTVALIRAALGDPDDKIAQQSSCAAGHSFHMQAFEVLLQGVAAADSESKRDRAASSLATYVLAASAPSPPEVRRLSIERDGTWRWEFSLTDPDWPTVPPEAYTSLLDMALNGTTEVQISSALYALARTEGLALLGEEIQRRLDAGDAVGALRLAEDILTVIPNAPQPQANAHWWRGLTLEQLQRWQEAVDAFSAAIERVPKQDDPVLGPLLEHRASAHIALGRYSAGLADLEAAIRIEPSSFRAQCLAAVCLCNLDRHVEATEVASQAIAIDPSVGRIWFVRAAARCNGGDASGALQDVRQAVTLAPDDEQAVTFKAELEAYLRGQGR